MDITEIIVVATGSLLIVAVLWWFFAPRKGAAATVMESGVQEIDIHVKGGYSPDRIEVKRGKPVRLNFFRDETSACSEVVVFSDFGIAKDLPAHKTTPIEFTPEQPGEFTFTCGMNMMRGVLVVE